MEVVLQCHVACATHRRVAKNRDMATKVACRWKVEEKKGEDDEGLVQLTAAYKTLQLHLKRLKQKLRYFSKRWEISNIAIFEEY